MTATAASELVEQQQTRLTSLVVRAFALLTVFLVTLALLVALTLPYGEWDAMSFGTWSREIAAAWPSIHFADAGSADYQRPLFYFAQGTIWRIFGFHVALGRLLSLFCSLLLLGATGWIGACIAQRSRRLGAMIAVVVLLLVAGFERYIVAGLSDIPATAFVTLAAAAVLTKRLGRARLPLVSVATTCAMLTKPSALPALAGLALAIVIGPRVDARRRLAAAAAIAVGTVAGLAYDVAQAAYLHVGLAGFLTAGTDGFYARLAAADRKRALLDGAWLGADLHLILWFALLYAVARLLTSHSRAVLIAFPSAVAWAEIGPRLGGTNTRIVSGGWLESAGIVLLAVALLLSIGAPEWSVPSRLQLGRALAWAVPPFLVWALRLDYDLRLLAPAWPPLVLLIVMSLLPAFAGAQRRSGLLILAPAAAMLILGVLAVNEINGLGASGWRQLRAISLTDSAALRDLALGGDFSAELDALKSRVSREDVIETYDQRLRFFYLDRVVIAAPTACSQMQGRQVLVLLESDEVRKLFGRRTSPAFWSACRSPHLEEVDERPGAYAILVNGTAPVTGGCGVAATPGLAVEFGIFRNQTAAQRVLGRVRSVGFVQATVERVGCQAYRVVETHVPNASVGRSIVAEAGTAHLRARLVGG